MDGFPTGHLGCRRANRDANSIRVRSATDSADSTVTPRRLGASITSHGAVAPRAATPIDSTHLYTREPHTPTHPRRPHHRAHEQEAPAEFGFETPPTSPTRQTVTPSVTTATVPVIHTTTPYPGSESGEFGFE